MLEVKQLSYRIKHKLLLHDAHFTARPGELLAVLGPNGAGKSTLVRLLSRSLLPASGHISWEGIPLNSYPEAELARRRAVLTQQVHMSYDFPVREVVLMGRYPHFKRLPRRQDWNAVEASMKLTGTSDFASRAYRSLSGGEQQRVQLARALAQIWPEADADERPRLLLLDEPLNNLDLRYQHHCLQLARQCAARGNVVLIVMHDLNLAAQYADRLLLLQKGRQIAFGSPQETLTEPLLSSCYEFPVRVAKHPFHHCPAVYFQHHNKTEQHNSFATLSQVNPNYHP